MKSDHAKRREILGKVEKRVAAFELNDLKILQRKLNLLIEHFDALMIYQRDMSPQECLAYRQRLGSFDFIIGGFGITKIK